MTLLQDTVKQAHPDAAVDGVPDEMLYTLYPELFPYGPGTAGFMKDANVVINHLMPHRRKNEAAFTALKNIAGRFRDELGTPNPVYADTIDAPLQKFLSLLDYQYQIIKDFPRLKKPLPFWQTSMIRAVHLRNILTHDMLLVLLICHTLSVHPSGDERLRSACETFMDQYAVWQREYLSN